MNLILNTNETDEKIKKLREKVNDRFDNKTALLINKAINFAVEKHKGQFRKSGDPFIIHPISVALILIEWDLDYETIIAGLLHDVIEDTQTSDNEIENNFGKEILFLIKAVTKISIYSSNNRSNNEYGHDNQNYLIQMFICMSQDLRVLFIKIADRYHNMKTIEYLKPESQKRIAIETQEIYANLAGRLGMYSIKNQMLDMCMKVLDNQKYEEIHKFIESSIQKNKNVFDEILTKIENELNNKNIIYKCSNRIKSVYSTYMKWLNIGDVKDLFAIRIIVKNTMDCYLVLGIIHSLFVYIKNSFKDFISSPKSNLYQSLHTMIFYKGLNVEIQIRTEQMDEIANFGIASHWRYKENYNLQLNNDIKNLFYKLNQDNNNNYDMSSIDERLNVIKKIAKQKFINIYNANKKEWVSINENTNVFEYVAMNFKNKLPYLKEVLVNGTPISIVNTFDSGDLVEVIFDDKKLINNSWKLYTKDESIRKLIDQELENISINIENDVNLFIKNINLNCNTSYSKREIEEFIKNNFNVDSIKTFINNLKVIKLNKNDLYNLFKNDEEIKNKIIKKINDKSWKCVWNNSYFESNNQIPVKEINITKCCSKLPFEDVVGVLRDNNILDVHKYECPYINNNDKLIVLTWNKQKIKNSDRSFRSEVVLKGYFSSNNIDNTSSNIISAIQKYHGIISNYSLIKQKTDKTFECKITIYVKNYSNLYKIMNELISKSIINEWKLI